MPTTTRRCFLQGAGLAPALGAVPSAAARPAGAGLPKHWLTMNAAEVRSSGDTITAHTGLVERVWRLTSAGLVTTSFRNLKTGRDWSSDTETDADWSYDGLLRGAAQLTSLEVRCVRFDPFTSDHIEILARFEYAEAKVALQYHVRVCPDAPGIWSQLSVKGLSGFRGDGIPAREDGRADRLPLTIGAARRRAIGYYNQTQQRNKPETELLREEAYQQPLAQPDVCDWASIYCIEDAGQGICLVKESHKCVNQQGVNTGHFLCEANALSSTGWGPAPADILTDRYRECWASWALAYDGGADGRELAIKIFDRQRYPIDPRRDIYIMANTWGSGGAKAESVEASREENILKQIASCKDLGIDVQQIDDGWQGDGYKTWQPVAARYPDGWTNVRSAARNAGVKLGLWAAWVIDEPSLLQTRDDGGFSYYKIDFANLDTYEKLEGLMGKMRRLIVHSGNTVRVNWDVTENPARVGYYYARELGNIYLENRKPHNPAHVIYIPHLVLRDAWHVARYLNLNKFQITVQNIDRINREVSDAHLHNHPYCVAIALMSSPIFFQETSYYTGEARREIRPLLALYKRHRRAMYQGYVFAIGDKPNNASWTGFQNWNPRTRGGYLTIFREREAASPKADIALRFVCGRQLRLYDLITGERREIAVPIDGRIAFEISSAPGFRFLRYEVV